MAIFSGPEIPNNGLVFHYDMSNSVKSWKGAPTTNLWSHSRLFSNWSKTASITVTDNSALSPNGDLTASTVTASGSGGSYIYLHNTSITTGNTYTKSVYAKAGTTSILVFETYDNNGSGGTGFFATTFDLNAGTFSAAFGDTVSMVYINNGWYRCSVTRSYTLTTASGTFYIGAYGTGTGSLYLWDAQLELGSFSTPTIVTLGATASRSTTQSILDLTNNNVVTASSLTYASDGTFSFNGSSNFINLNNNIQSGYTSASYEFWCRTTSLPGSGNYFQLYIQENSTWIGLYNVGSGAFFGIDLNNGSGWFDNNGGSNTGARTTTTLSSNTSYYVAYSWNGSTVSVYLNGNLQATVSTLQAANGRQNVTQLGAGTTPRNIGSRSNGGANNWVGTINSVRFYNRALSAVEVRQNFEAARGRYGI